MTDKIKVGDYFRTGDSAGYVYRVADEEQAAQLNKHYQHYQRVTVRDAKPCNKLTRTQADAWMLEYNINPRTDGILSIQPVAYGLWRVVNSGNGNDRSYSGASYVKAVIAARKALVCK